jgi:phosphate transport system protein
MARELFRKHIIQLENEMVELGKMGINAVEQSIEALKTHNTAVANKIVYDDALINKKRWEIEDKCINLIALQQPVASDLREIIAILNIVTDLERIGDYAEGIAKIVIMIGDEPLVRTLDSLPKMAKKGIDMLDRAIIAFVKRDADAAFKICNEDDEVDALHEQAYHNLLQCMIQNPSQITGATRLIWASHNLERIADRVTNICERTVFLVTGSVQKINVSKY